MNTNITKVEAKSLKVGDIISHWSPTGGFWRVEGRWGVKRRLVSDVGAVRYFTDEQIDAKGAYLISDPSQKFQ